MGNSYGLMSACPELKDAYQRCEKEQWEYFRKTGDISSNPCRDAFEDYKLCVMGVWENKTRQYEQRHGIRPSASATAVVEESAGPSRPSTPSSTDATASSTGAATHSSGSDASTAAR